jgi:polyisoprenyl-teichoic acid--peptidoglycan teichoic acid transferase
MMDEHPGAGSDPREDEADQTAAAGGSDPSDTASPSDPSDAASSDASNADALPPPSTWAGRARQSGGSTEEFDGLTDELSAEFDDLQTDEDEFAHAEADEQEDPPDEFTFEEDEHQDAGSDPRSDESEQPVEAGGSDPSDTASSSDPSATADPSAPASPPDPSDAASPSDPSDTADPESNADDQPDGTPIPGVTVEADTLTLSDVEAAREAAHAGLAARAKGSSFSHHKTTSSHKVPAKPAPPAPSASPPAASAESEGVGKPPKRRIGWRFVAAAAVIVSSMAAATAVSFLLFLSDIAEGLNDSDLTAARAELEAVEGGKPQTILILGSDERNSTEGLPARSDTALLLRVDPEKNFLSLMSLPRDLQVPIPGYGTDKLNAAYSFGEQANPKGGGETLAIKTITGFLGIPINHVVNVNFTGFYEAVNAIGCVYIDVDRHYLNTNEGTFEGSENFYSEIDVESGYQKLCGYKALQYVRFRHTDNDIVRGARQQDFIREARQRIPPRKLLPVLGEGNELIEIFTKNTSSDINSASTIVSMMKSFIDVRDAPVRQVSLGSLRDDGNVDATREQVEVAVNQFLGNDLDNEPEQPAAPPSEPNEPTKPNDSKGDGGGNGDKPDPPSGPPAQALVDFAGPSSEKAAEFDKFLEEKKADLPVFYPTKLVQSAITAVSPESRAAVLVGESEKELYYMYKYVLPYADTFGPAYYGVSGTNWADPPILKNPSEIREIDGRDYMLYYERDRLRLVGWQTSKGSYWVNNTLTHSLSADAMLGIATSTRELGN